MCALLGCACRASGDVRAAHAPHPRSRTSSARIDGPATGAQPLLSQLLLRGFPSPKAGPLSSKTPDRPRRLRGTEACEPVLYVRNLLALLTSPATGTRPSQLGCNGERRAFFPRGRGGGAWRNRTGWRRVRTVDRSDPLRWSRPRPVGRSFARVLSPGEHRLQPGNGCTLRPSGDRRP